MGIYNILKWSNLDAGSMLATLPYIQTKKKKFIQNLFLFYFLDIGPGEYCTKLFENKTSVPLTIK